MSDILSFLSSTGIYISALIAVVIGIVSLLVQMGLTSRLKWNTEERVALSKEPPQKREVEQIEGVAIIEELTPAERQYRLLSQYHSQGLEQSKISFWFSLIFAALGFLVLITGIFTMDNGVQFTEQGRAFITLLAGTIIDAVAALFFVQSNKARELMTNFFDKLRADRKLEEALSLCQEIQDGNVQGRLQTLLALKFAEVQFNDSLLTSMLSSPTSVGTDSKLDKVVTQDSKTETKVEAISARG